MRALILAAGYGTRLGALTKNSPKPLLKVGGKSVVERIIDRLHLHGINQILVNVHYLPEMVVEKLEGNALYYYEPRLLGHQGTINSLRQWLFNDDFFVINGDTASNVDFTQMKTIHQPNSITVLMEEWRCAGTWLYSKEFFTNPSLPVIPYRPNQLAWHDIGNPKRLKEAKEYYK